jgi:hypothetical protein
MSLTVAFASVTEPAAHSLVADQRAGIADPPPSAAHNTGFGHERRKINLAPRKSAT